MTGFVVQGHILFSTKYSQLLLKHVFYSLRSNVWFMWSFIVLLLSFFEQSIVSVENSWAS